MSKSIINNTLTVAVTLGTGYYTSNLLIEPAGAIDPQGAIGIFVPEHLLNATIINEGSIIVTPGYDGIKLSAPTSVNTSGYIFAAYGIVSSVTSSITNSGTIHAQVYGVQLEGKGLITNSGSIYGRNAGVLLADGTLINNGSISGAANGVQVTAAGSLINFGVLYDGVLLENGAQMTNYGTVQGHGGNIDLFDPGKINNFGIVNANVDLASGSIINAGTVNGLISSYDLTEVINTGQINQITGFGDTIINSGSIIKGVNLNLAATLSNYGSIDSAFYGVDASGSSFTNRAQIFGGDIGLILNSSNGKNLGTISGQSLGVKIEASGYLNNTGLVYGKIYGVELLTGATAFNSGTVSSQYGGAYIYTGSLTNTGSIFGSEGGAGVKDGLLTNAGNIYGSVVGVGLATGGTLLNTGTISGHTYGLELVGGTASNSGIISAATYGVVLYGGSIFNAGTISSKYGVVMVGGTLTNADTISGVQFAVEGVSFALNVDSTAVFHGNVIDRTQKSTLIFGGTSSGFLSGIGTSFSGFNTIAFAAGAHWEIEGNQKGLANGQNISGFTFGDTIVLDGFDAMLDRFANNALTLTNGVTKTVLDIEGNFSTSSFSISSTAIETEIVMLCYIRGTMILAACGPVAIEDLNVGDTIITRFHGRQTIKWIGRQSFAARFIRNNRAQIPVRIAASALGHNIPAQDLYVSPGHSLLLDKTLVLAKSLINGITITQPEPIEDIHYYLIEFATHDCVLANGAWAESFADASGLRNQFHNAVEFQKLFPNYQTPNVLTLCAPRPERGPALDAALRPIAARAAAGTTPGPLRGCIDLTFPTIEGWAQDTANPELPVLLEILSGRHIIGTILACDYRPDLAAAGIGTGRCHFAFTPPAPLSAKTLQDISIRRATDGAELYPVSTRVKTKNFS